MYTELRIAQGLSLLGLLMSALGILAAFLQRRLAQRPTDVVQYFGVASETLVVLFFLVVVLSFGVLPPVLRRTFPGKIDSEGSQIVGAQ
jgi:hypothetical protein